MWKQILLWWTIPMVSLLGTSCFYFDPCEGAERPTLCCAEPITIETDAGLPLKVTFSCDEPDAGSD